MDMLHVEGFALRGNERDEGIAQMRAFLEDFDYREVYRSGKPNPEILGGLAHLEALHCPPEEQGLISSRETYIGWARELLLSEQN